jgi:integrase
MLIFLTPHDLNFRKKEIRVTAKEEFIPKDYEEREIPVPAELIEILKSLPRDSKWVFPDENGNHLGRNDLLNRLKKIAKQVGVAKPTLHKFRIRMRRGCLKAGRILLQYNIFLAILTSRQPGSI